ncbi:MAG TPA: DUF1768 domain-containing protein [Planktothrix sp. UBA8407]|jgi:conserved hypothetical protein, ribA/ribD-fused|nr:DUF1768 domain-containing protein [Planktothrix sp. UBA8407]HBK21535.1 DUF1768 domain-containing protein [Planktothrix sp. UBA10369]
MNHQILLAYLEIFRGEIMQTSSQIRTYNRNECITFRKTKESFGGLSNMAGGYPLIVNGIHILTSEALYQACRFPHLPDIQKLIIAQNSPMTAKMKGKPYRDQSRSDWERVKVSIMRWCLRVKLLQNWDKFGQLLLETGDKAIVEDSHKDDFWGAIPTDYDQLIGINALGRLLMELREHLKQDANSLKSLKPLEIPDFIFLSKPIEFLTLKDDNYTLSIQEKQLIIPLIPEIILESNVSLDQTKEFYREETIITDTNIEKTEKDDNIFDGWVLPKLEKILQNYQSYDQILQHFKTVNKKQMQDWMKLAVELGKVKKIEKPVRYIWYSAYESESNPTKAKKVSQPRNTRKTQLKSSQKSKSNVAQESTQLSLI